MSNAYPISVHSLPKLIAENTLSGGLAVVIDVLRATTVMAHAVEAGIRQIIPCLEIDEARSVAASFVPGTALLGGERQGLPIEGFDLGNSPASYSSQRCRAKTLVMTTTNGTRALHTSLDAERILVAAFVNRTATLRSIEGDPIQRPVHLICAGTDGQISLEDTLLAGAIASRLAARTGRLANDEARMAAMLWDSLSIDEDPDIAEDRLYRVLSEGRGGIRVREIGLEPDLRDASRIDRFPFAIGLLREPIRLERV